MPKLETLELEIVQKSKTSTAGVKNLAEALSNLAKAGEAAGSLKPVATSLKAIAAAADGLKAASSGIRSMAGAMARLGEALGESANAVDGLQKIAVALEKISEAASGISGVGANIREINRAAKSAAKTPAVSPAQGGENPTALLPKGVDETTKSIQNLNMNLQGASVSMNNFSASVKTNKATLSAGSIAISNFGKALLKIPIGKLKASIKQFTVNIGKLFGSFKRIAGYRAIRTSIRGITQGFATGVKHLYAWADLVGNNFKQSMDSLSTSMNYLKNSLGAMVSPIIDALAPAVEILVDKFVDLINVVNQFLATITGASSWRRAVKEQKEYADETDKAAGAQQRLNHQLMAFDELNNITVNQPSSRGSGNNDDEVTDGSFVVEQLPDWAKDIREAIESGAWGEAGSLLGEKINDLVAGWDASEWGKKIGRKIGNGIDFYNGLMDTTDWESLGGKVADFLDSIIDEVDGKDLGHAIVAKFNAGIEFLAGFTGEFDWSAAGKWLADVLVGAFTGINWSSFGELVGNLAGGILDMLKAGITELISHGDEVIKAIGEFFSGLGWDGLVDVVSILGLVSVFKTLFGSAAGKAAADSSTFAGVGTTLKSTLSSALLLAGGASIIIDFLVNTGKGFVTWDEFLEGFADGPTALTGNELDGGDYAARYVNAYQQGNWWTRIQGDETYQFMQAMAESAELQKIYNDTLEQYKDYVDETMATDKYSIARTTAMNAWRKGVGRGATEPSSANWMSADRGQRFMPEIDNTQQITALSEIEEAAVSARKKVHELPPSDDEVSKFKDNAIKMAGTNGVGAVTEAAKTARAKVKQISPDASERTDFLDAMKKERDGVNLIKTAANNTGSAVDGIKPTTKETNAFKDKTTVWGKAVEVIKTAAEKAGKQMDKLPNKKSFTYTDSGSGLKNAAKNATTMTTQLGGLLNKYTFKVDSSTLGDKADEAEKLYKALNNINSKSWKIQVTGDMKLKMVSERGNAMYFVEPMATGGFPETGQLFVANEAGPELIGTVNGKNAVASNGEITGIADAVYNTGEEEATLLREQNQLLRQLLAKNTNISLAPNVAAGRWVAQASNAYRKATGG